MRRSAERGFRSATAAGLRPRRAALPRGAGPASCPRPGRRQPHHLLVPGVPVVKRVGHKGADHVAPGTPSPASSCAGARRRHDRVRRAAPARRPAGAGPRLHGRRRARAAHAGGGARPSSPARPTPDVELDVDMKMPGYEREVVEGLRARPDRARAHLDHVPARASTQVGRAGARAARAGWSVPKVQRDYTRASLALGRAGAAAVWRARLPERAARLIRDGRVRGLMSHWLLVSRRLVGARARSRRRALRLDGRRRRPHQQRSRRWAWTAVITNDPRLFARASGPRRVQAPRESRRRPDVAVRPGRPGWRRWP